MERKSARELVTKSGSLYRLVGDLQKKSLSQSLSTALGSKFRRGFPPRWQMYIANALMRSELRLCNSHKHIPLCVCVCVCVCSSGQVKVEVKEEQEKDAVPSTPKLNSTGVLIVALSIHSTDSSSTHPGCSRHLQPLWV